MIFVVDIWPSFDAEQWWWRIWPDGQENGELVNFKAMTRCPAASHRIDKVAKLKSLNQLSPYWGLSDHYIYISSAGVILTLLKKNSFRDVHKTANIFSSRNVCSETAKSRQNVHLVYYHIEECWTNQRFWKVVADDIMRNDFSTCPHFWPRTHQIDQIKLSCVQLVKKVEGEKNTKLVILIGWNLCHAIKFFNRGWKCFLLMFLDQR